jgi:hypothetical protein
MIDNFEIRKAEAELVAWPLTVLKVGGLNPSIAYRHKIFDFSLSFIIFQIFDDGYSTFSIEKLYMGFIWVRCNKFIIIWYQIFKIRFNVVSSKMNVWKVG